MPPRAQPRFIDDYLSYLLARASHAVYKEFEQTVNAAGLASLEWRVLATLDGVESMTIGDLAREVLAKQPTLTKLIQRMREAGWVECSADAEDARRTRVSATPRGRRTIERLMVAAKAHEKEILATFDASAVETLKAVLRTLIARPEAAN
jgi:DNA-binding MarR family transcriptional regulator